MNETLKKLWDEYLLDKCAVIDTDEERALTRAAAELNEKAISLLNQEQQDAVEKYVDALCDVDALFARKAFLKGFEFSFSLLFETGIFEKAD